jgi:predicted nucleic acid-binding protein
MKKNRVYLDNCCFNRPYDSQVSMAIKLETEAKLSIQDKIKSGIIELAWSYMLDFENDANSNFMKKNFIGEWINYAVTDIDETDIIIDTAEKLYSKGFKENDALHIACAFAGECDYFITVDKGILNKKEMVENIMIVDPIDYCKLVEV